MTNLEINAGITRIETILRKRGILASESNPSGCAVHYVVNNEIPWQIGDAQQSESYATQGGAGAESWLKAIPPGL